MATMLDHHAFDDGSKFEVIVRMEGDVNTFVEVDGMGYYSSIDNESFRDDATDEKIADDLPCVDEIVGRFCQPDATVVVGYHRDTGFVVLETMPID